MVENPFIIVKNKQTKTPQTKNKKTKKKYLSKNKISKKYVQVLWRKCKILLRDTKEDIKENKKYNIVSSKIQ